MRPQVYLLYIKALSRFKISCISNLTSVRLELIEKRDVEKGSVISGGCSTWGGVRHVGVGTYNFESFGWLVLCRAHLVSEGDDLRFHAAGGRCRSEGLGLLVS